MWFYFLRCNTSRQSTSSVCGHGADGQFQSEVWRERLRFTVYGQPPKQPRRKPKPQLGGVLVWLERAFYFINLEPVNCAHCGVGCHSLVTCWAMVLAPVGASISCCELTNPICLSVFVFVPPLLALLGPNVRYPQGQRADGS